MSYLRDSHGNPVGRIEDVGAVQRIYDASGRLLATYNKDTNTTVGASGSTVLRDNQLMTFLRR